VGWESLPSELIELLCEWLHIATVLRLNVVCSLWKAALDDETLWRRRFTHSFGPLSSCHLTLPRPPHLRGSATITSMRVLKWTKRVFVMRNCKRSGNYTWPLLNGCSHVIREKIRTVRRQEVVNDRSAS